MVHWNQLLCIGRDKCLQLTACCNETGQTGSNHPHYGNWVCPGVIVRVARFSRAVRALRAGSVVSGGGGVSGGAAGTGRPGNGDHDRARV